MEKYIANTKVSVNGKNFEAGTEITEKLRDCDKRFLLSEGYIKCVKDEKKAAKSSAAEETKPVVKETKKS